jgi:hypothetical protein
LAKGQKRSNREIKKPKGNKKNPGAAASALTAIPAKKKPGYK